MRGELASTQRDLEASRSIRGELATELANATTDLRLAEERLEAERVRADGLIKQIEEKEQALANLTTENQKLEASLAEAAKTEIFLSEELQRFKYGIVPGDEPCGEQLQLFPTQEEPEEQAAVTPELPTRQPEQPSLISNQSPVISEEQPPAVNSEESEVSSQESEPDSKPKILKSSETADYINQNFNPEKLITRQNLTDAARGASKKMPEYERLYGFKFLGKIKGEYAYEIQSQG